MTTQLSSYPHKRRDYVHEDQTEHRVRPLDLGRRLVLQRVDPCASGGGARGGVGPEQPRHAQRRRRGSHPSAWTGQQPGHPRRPLVGRNRHHSRGNRRTRCRAGLHRRSRPGRRRDDALLMAAFFIVGGVFRIATALLFRIPGRAWVVAGGTVTVALGVIIAAEWPVSAVWVIGTFVGIDLIFDGWSLVMAGLGARELAADDRRAMSAPLPGR